jgi:hypothetical protein
MLNLEECFFAIKARTSIQIQYRLLVGWLYCDGVK